MTRSRDARSVAVQVRSADRWISRTAAATVAGLAGIAGALSYSHMHELALAYGQAGWHAHAFPLSVDGVEIVASLVLLAERRAGSRSGWLPWTALAAGTAGSLAANIATAHPDPVSRIIAGWPALALLLAIKLLSEMLESRHVLGRRSRKSGRTSAVRSQIRPNRSLSRHQQAETGQSGVVVLDGRAAALLPAARALRDALHRDGQSLTRDTLAARLRQSGHPIRNATVALLLRQLRRELPH